MDQLSGRGGPCRLVWKTNFSHFFCEGLPKLWPLDWLWRKVSLQRGSKIWNCTNYNMQYYKYFPGWKALGFPSSIHGVHAKHLIKNYIVKVLNNESMPKKIKTSLKGIRASTCFVGPKNTTLLLSAIFFILVVRRLSAEPSGGHFFFSQVRFTD